MGSVVSGWQIATLILCGYSHCGHDVAGNRDPMHYQAQKVMSLLTKDLIYKCFRISVSKTL